MNTGSSLAQKHCAECEGKAKPLTVSEAQELRKQLDPAWAIQEQHHLDREFKFKDFRQALVFVNRIGDVAENEGHHPDLQLGWGYVRVTLWTHSVNALTEGDFVLAAKIDQIR